MSFKDIKGQDSAISFLRRSIESARTAHAYLFTGPAGVGKRLAAINFAKALNCKGQGIGASDVPCDTCASCKKIGSSSHPDVMVFAPGEKNGSIGIDDIRRLISVISFKPYEGKKKVMIIDSADVMTDESQNALLKTLEEPTSDSVIVLVAGSDRGLFRTIVSRCEIVRFRPLDPEAVKKELSSTHGFDTTKAHVASRLSGGSIGAALRFKDDSAFASRGSFVEALASGRFAEIDFDDVARGDLAFYLDIMLSWYRDILLLKTSPANKDRIANIDRLGDIKRQALSSDLGRIDEAIKSIIETEDNLERNANAKLAMSVLQARIRG